MPTGRVNAKDRIQILVRGNSRDFVTIDQVRGSRFATSLTLSYDITEFAAAATRIRIKVKKGLDGADEAFVVRNLEVYFDTCTDSSGPTRAPDVPSTTRAEEAYVTLTFPGVNFNSMLGGDGDSTEARRFVSALRTTLSELAPSTDITSIRLMPGSIIAIVGFSSVTSAAEVAAAAQTRTICVDFDEEAVCTPPLIGKQVEVIVGDHEAAKEATGGPSAVVVAMGVGVGLVCLVALVLATVIVRRRSLRHRASGLELESDDMFGQGGSVEDASVVAQQVALSQQRHVAPLGSVYTRSAEDLTPPADWAVENHTADGASAWPEELILSWSSAASPPLAAREAKRQLAAMG
jgi:hypothetical protein